MKHYQRKNRAPLKPYANTANRFRVAIERHEKRVAQHTSIQSWIGGLQLFVGLLTTLVLIYVAYLQYESSDRQVALEYAKVSPIFSVKADMMGNPSDADGLYLPREISIKLLRGEATIKEIEAYQDLEVSILPEKENKTHFRCILRINNYFKVDSGNSNLQSASFLNRYLNKSKFFFPDWPGDFALLEPKNTWLRISYVDIFGRDQSVIFGGQGSNISMLPSKEFGGDALTEVAISEFRHNASTFPKLWVRQQRQYKTDGCRYILDTIQR